VQRIKTGVSKLDEIIEGFPSGKTILLTGEPGSGKTIFGLQFAGHSCSLGLRTTYVTTEEKTDDLRAQAASVGLDIATAEQKELLTFVDFFGPRASLIENSLKLKVKPKRNFIEIVHEIPRQIDGQVLIIDNLGAFTTHLEVNEFRERLDILIHYLMEKCITTLLIMDHATFTEFNELGFYATYGAIRLMKQVNPYTGARERQMDIIKMRNTRTPLQPMVYEIGSNGIEIVS
jgi:KaiC/GvpD/RAD55 family RecA-like ATPase